MGVAVDQSQLERVLAVLRESPAYHDVKTGLNEYFHDDGWAGEAAGSGPFALAFTRNLENEGGWLSQSDLAVFWHAAEQVDPNQPSETDALHQFLVERIASWQQEATASADPEPVGFQSVTEMSGALYAGWRQGYDPAADVWKYRDPDDGLWKESRQAFPPVASGSRIFRVGERGGRMFLTDGDAEREVWPHPHTPGAYYDSAGEYDQMGNPLAHTPATAEAGFQNITEMAGALYAGWRQGYDPAAGAWKYRDPDDGLWKESGQAFPPVVAGSRIFRIGGRSSRTFLADGDAVHEVWQHPDTLGAFYDAANTYDQSGNAITRTPATADARPAADEAGKRVDQAELERELRELFDIPADVPVWVSEP